MVEHLGGGGADARYTGFFECFNRQEFFDAHEVLEDLWLEEKTSPNYSFHKGLIQLAGAFVHLQKGRLRPAASLFNLADANFARYPETHEQLDVASVRNLIRNCLSELEAGQFQHNPWRPGRSPTLSLLPRNP